MQLDCRQFSWRLQYAMPVEADVALSLGKKHAKIISF